MVERLLEDLEARGKIAGRPSDDQLVELIIDEYIRFPSPTAA